jgi:hypothetical protein
MSHDATQNTDRRTFLQAGAVATASALALSGGATAQAADPKVLPKRKLGKTGVEITMLEMGSGALRDRSVLDRLIRLSYAAGVRTFDTANLYGTEPGFKAWFAQSPEVRKEIVLVTKDELRTPKEMLKKLDERLAALGTDYVDGYFIHGLGDKMSLDTAIDFAKGQEMKETAEAIKKSGKARFVGFSCHDPLKVEFLKAAAEGGFVDAIMVAYTPTWLDKGQAMDRALDACHKRGIGLISMKQVSGNSDKILKEVPKHVPSMQEKGLTGYQGLLHAVWTDERIASSCVSMRNTDQLRENVHAARVFTPLKQAEMDGLRDALLAAGQTFCANCDGSCSRAAGTDAALGDLTRLLTYHDHYGFRSDARRLYSELDESARDWKGADLEAARQACHNKLDFASLLPRVDRDLA